MSSWWQPGEIGCAERIWMGWRRCRVLSLQRMLLQFSQKAFQLLPSHIRRLSSANQVLLRWNGKYVFSSTLSNQTVSAKSVTSTPINSSWTVDFLVELMPPKRGGISITLKFLQPLKDHSDFDVAHFPSTATYTTSFTLSSIDKSSTRYVTNYRHYAET